MSCSGDEDDVYLYTGVFGMNSTTTMGQITDGTSQTMMISECKVAAPFNKYYGNGLYFRCLAGTARPIFDHQGEPRGFSWFYAQVTQA